MTDANPSSGTKFAEAPAVLACTAAGALLAFSLGTSVAAGSAVGAFVAFAVIAARAHAGNR
jgi:hypothetical protein